MTTTATGPNGVAMQKLAELLSESTTWQTRCGVSTAALALKHIHYPHFKDKDESERPVAIISRSPDGGFQADRTAGGGKNYFLLNGSLMLMIVDELDAFDDEKDPDVDFHNFTESVLDHLLEQAAVDDNLAISAIAATIPPARTDDTEVADGHATQATYLAEWRIDWDQC
jgi:hypothetical protein